MSIGVMGGWGDSIRRHRRLRDQGIHFVDLGTSGGVEGVRTGPASWRGRGARDRENEDIARERREGRIGGFYRKE